MHIKRQARVLGIDDGPFDKFRDKETIIVGTVFRGGEFLDGILSTKITIDGEDSTKNIFHMVNKCKFVTQLQLIILDGIAVGGFNVIDIQKLHEKTNIPVMVVMRNMPNIEKVKTTLNQIGMEEKIKLIEKAGKPIKINNLYVQLAGIDKEKAKEFLRLTLKNAQVPEPIRIAHIIASGIVKGESYGKA